MSNDQLLVTPIMIDFFVTRFDSIKKYNSGIIKMSVKGREEVMSRVK